jgi:hypothetical protein
MTTEKVTLFIDAQSLYNAIRGAFFSDTDNHAYGQVDPMKLANFICSRPPPGVTRVLNEVRVYSGRPDPTKDPRTHAAHMKQCAAWSRGGAHVITRQLRYPREWPNLKAQEKAIVVGLNSPRTAKRRLRVPGYSLYCYWIDAGLYGTIADTTDYNL